MDDFARFFDNSLDLNGIASPEGYFRRVNIAWQRTLGWTAEEISTIPWLELVHPDDRQSTIDAGRQLFEGASIISFENRYRCKDNSYRLIQWHAEVVDGEAYCSGRDVTEARSQLELRIVIDNLPDLAWTARPDGFIDFYNRRWYEYTGTTYESMQGWGWQSVHDPDELPRVIASWTRCIATHQPFDQALPLRRKDGVFRWFLTRAAPIFNSTGQVIRWVGVNTDIDDQRRDQEARQQAEQDRMRLVAQLQALNIDLEERVLRRTSELSRTLKEREVLLQEVHHRVKNNLQVISSLINMQVRQVTDAPTRRALDECKTRVEAIALIHEKLYQSQDYARIPFSEYARTLVMSIFRTMGVVQDAVTMTIDIDALSLAVDKAIPCGLILNELITNALKHAFPDGQRGSIQVTLRAASFGEVTLSVADDGVGLHASFEVGAAKSLGMELVATLVEQLDGRLEIVRRGGTTFRVTFSTDT
jgi:PAS domain S-box-containing protein